MSDADNQAAVPFEQLSPQTVLDCVDSLGFQTDGRLLGLNSYENRVYQVYIDVESTPPQLASQLGADKTRIVTKFYRPNRWTQTQVLEEHEFASELVAAEIPCVPALTVQVNSVGNTLHRAHDYWFAAFACKGGRAPNLEDDSVLEWIGRFIGRIHAVGAAKPFTHRQQHDAKTLGQEAFDWVTSSGFVPQELNEAWHSIARQALTLVTQTLDQVTQTIRLHGDCHVGNILWQEQSGPHFVDLDDCRQGPAVQDLWMLLASEPDIASAQLKAILKGYRQFHDFDRQELKWIEALRTLRLLHYSAWIGRRWDDPAFKRAFAWFESPRYWQDRILELREQVALMQEPPQYMQ
jgi:Ser/Thr protein kinase RdoA (MazF antagonist)